MIEISLSDWITKYWFWCFVWGCSSIFISAFLYSMIDVIYNPTIRNENTPKDKPWKIIICLALLTLSGWICLVVGTVILISENITIT
jgi:hypothetical protein